MPSLQSGIPNLLSATNPEVAWVQSSHPLWRYTGDNANGHPRYEFVDPLGNTHLVTGFMGSHGRDKSAPMNRIRGNLNRFFNRCQNGACSHVFSGPTSGEPTTGGSGQPIVYRPGDVVQYRGEPHYVTAAEPIGSEMFYDLAHQNGTAYQTVPQGELDQDPPAPRTTVQSNILDPIHRSLPVIWEHAESDRPTLKPHYAHFIKTHVYDALTHYGYDHPQRWCRLYLSGSLCTYQYGPHSDVDVNVFVNSDKLPEWSRAKMIGVMVNHLDGLILPGTTYPLQVFVMPAGATPAEKYRPGIRAGYDIDNNRWVEPPDRARAMDVSKEENGFYEYGKLVADKMASLLKHEPRKALQYYHEIHRKRQIDAEKGDYNLWNILYKMLDREGLIEPLHRLDQMSRTSAVRPVDLSILNQPRHVYQGTPFRPYYDVVDRDSPEERAYAEKTKDWTPEQKRAERARAEEWDRVARYAIATGYMTPQAVTDLGYHPHSYEVGDSWTDPAWGRWRPLPSPLYHVTTNIPGIHRAGRLYSPDELDLEGMGRGLGGGTQDTISLTDNARTAENIRNAFREAADVASGRKSVQDLVDEAAAGTNADRPWLEHMYPYHDWSQGNPRELDNLLKGRRTFSRYNLPDDHPLRDDTLGLRTREQWGQFGYYPYENERPMESGRGPLFNDQQVYRNLSPQEANQQAFDWWRVPYAWARDGAGGPKNPVFTGVDPDWFAKLDPANIGIVQLNPVPNAHGYPMSGLGEWRVPTGDAMNITHINGFPYEGWQ